MPKYQIQIRESFAKTVIVEASSAEAALKNAEDKYHNGQFRLDSDCFEDVEFRPVCAECETPYEAGRYLKKQRLKDSAPKVVIEVKDGAVVRVWSTNPYTKIDWFDAAEDAVYAACARQDAAREHMVKIIDEEELL